MSFNNIQTPGANLLHSACKSNSQCRRQQPQSNKFFQEGKTRAVPLTQNTVCHVAALHSGLCKLDEVEDLTIVKKNGVAGFIRDFSQ